MERLSYSGILKFFLYDLIWTSVLLFPVAFFLSLLNELNFIKFVEYYITRFFDFIGSNPLKALIFFIAICIYYILVINNIKKWARKNDYSILKIRRCRLCDLPFDFFRFFFPNYQVFLKLKKETDIKIVILTFGNLASIEKVSWKEK